MYNQEPRNLQVPNKLIKMTKRFIQKIHIFNMIRPETHKSRLVGALRFFHKTLNEELSFSPIFNILSNKYIDIEGAAGVHGIGWHGEQSRVRPPGRG